MWRAVWCLLVVRAQPGLGDSQKCYRGGEAARRVRDWISSSMMTCRTDGNCPVEKFHDIFLTRVGSWYITSGWNVSSTALLRPRAEAYQGAFYYPGDGTGTYIYPDWASCVEGRWSSHLLQEGHYCSITEVCLSDNNNLTLTTDVTLNKTLSYSPPSYSTFGLPPTMRDPFENNSVEVKISHIKGSDEGLFTTRDIRSGELISFYSGLFLDCDSIIMPLNRWSHEMTKPDLMKIRMLVIFVTFS